jgi:hypothetical protein
MTDKKSFSKTRSTTFDVNKLKQKYQKISGKTKNDYSDNRFWTLTVDKVQNGKATIRFLPSTILDNKDDLPFVEKYTHYFEGAGGKLWEVCPNVIGKECPICKANSLLYKKAKEGDEEAKKIAAKRKKQKKFITNIYVVDDEGNPDNNGKVFMFEIGPDIFDRIFAQMDKVESEDEDEVVLPQVIPFMVDGTGADFVLESHYEDGYRKYSKSRYKKPKALNVDDIDEVLAQQHDLKEYFEKEIASKVKSYDELQRKMDAVLKQRTVSESVEDQMEDEDVRNAMESSDDEETASETTATKTKSKQKEEAVDIDLDIESMVDDILNS